uniref:ATP synthase F0 subunit 8 n=1 Tax=Neohylomys hainanensis TaxID=483536 RepID=UPI0020284DAC|nr:ATP synthase F0 subunit 8 [Neohylomys hainanensis]UQJ74099.1 ATP synthase F0 subunit 8 [Neohylomys hainanensis]
MPQLDTSTWFWTIVFMLISLLILFQLKFSKYSFFHNPEVKLMKTITHKNPWEMKWTKIYSPLSLPLYL